MSSKALKIMAGITLLLAVFLAYVAYQMSQKLTTAPQTQAIETREERQLAYTMAVVVIKPLRAHQAIEESQVQLVPVSVLPPAYYKAVDEVVGKTPLVDVEPGTTLTHRLFEQASQLTQSIPSGHRAMSLEIDDVIAVGGFVLPGNEVDVLLYIQSKSKEVEDSQARLLLEKTLVLAYEERVLAEPVLDEDGKESGQQRQRRQRTVVLAVPEKDTVRVMLGASVGEMRLALHGAPALEDDAKAGDVAIADDKPVSKPDESEATIKPITLTELSALKKARQSQPAYVSRPIAVYRGNDVETVRR